MNKYRYSEIFSSIQGEGYYTGVPTMWVRWFLCNLQCSGFGQTNPADESTWVLPYKEFDISQIKRVEDLPVWDKGCDSSYSWAKKYKHLSPEETVAEIADRIEALMRNDFNPHGRFAHPHARQVQHLCMTGGEPMLKKTQAGMVELIRELQHRNNFPQYITIETNGTQLPTRELIDLIEEKYTLTRMEWFWSVSPKLLHTSGEKASKAIHPEIVAEYARLSPAGQLKFVVRNDKVAWEELEERVADFRKAGVAWDVWVMPVGATVEEQSDDDTRAVVEETIRRGYNVSGRMHAYIWGNAIGT